MRAPKGSKSGAIAESSSNNASKDGTRDDRPMDNAQGSEMGPALAELLTEETEDAPLSDGWLELGDDDDNASIASTGTGFSSREGSPLGAKMQQPKLEIVIEDSEWDSAEVLD
ncbi:MAG: hypothetical protein Q9218_002727 [Villophora microphyllina]